MYCKDKKIGLQAKFMFLKSEFEIFCNALIILLSIYLSNNFYSDLFGQIQNGLKD